MATYRGYITSSRCPLGFTCVLSVKNMARHIVCVLDRMVGHVSICWDYVSTFLCNKMSLDITISTYMDHIFIHFKNKLKCFLFICTSKIASEIRWLMKKVSFLTPPHRGQIFRVCLPQDNLEPISFWRLSSYNCCHGNTKNFES